MIGEKEPATNLSSISKDSNIWRYTTLAKFVNIIRKGSSNSQAELVFRRADLFDDEYEGTFPREYKQYQNDLWSETFSSPNIEVKVDPEEVGVDSDEQSFDDVGLMRKSDELFRNRMRKITYVNCWRQDEYESSNMWRAYTTPSDGIAIKSTVGNLINAFRVWEHRLFISEVDYKNFDEIQNRFLKGEFQFVDLTALSPFFLKREEFKDEREIRAVMTKYDHPELYPSGHLEKVAESSHDENCYATVNIEELIEEIVVHPDSKPYLKQTVKHLLSKHDVGPKLISESSLKS